MAIHHDPVPQRKDAAAFHLSQYVLFGKGFEKALHILRIIVFSGSLPNFFKKVRSVLRLRKALCIIVCRGKLTIAICFRVYQIDADKLACECMEAGIDDAFFFDSFLRLALFHQLVDIRYRDDDKIFITIGTGNPHSDIERSPLFDSAVCHFKEIGAT